MQFSSLADFIVMDGHGLYVWLSYGVSALLILILILISRSANQEIKTKINLREQRNKKIKAAKLKQHNGEALSTSGGGLDQPQTHQSSE